MGKYKKGKKKRKDKKPINDIEIKYLKIIDFNTNQKIDFLDLKDLAIHYNANIFIFLQGIRKNKFYYYKRNKYHFLITSINYKRFYDSDYEWLVRYKDEVNDLVDDIIPKDDNTPKVNSWYMNKDGFFYNTKEQKHMSW